MDITSLQNPRIKQLVKLRERRTRDEEGLMLVEGVYEIETALQSGLAPQAIFTSPEVAGDRSLSFSDTECLTVSPQVFAKVSYRDHPDGWLAVFPIPQHALDEITLPDIPFIVIAEAVEKPGNLGAILRTADAAGVDALLVCDPRVDIYNPNVVRASRGTVFTVPVVQASNQQAFDWLRKNRIMILAATPSAARIFSDVDLRESVAIAVGTEDEGLSEFWMSRTDERVLIPMKGKVNSLNVAASVAIIAYEVVRQRNVR
jgi:RNA methyltransferase, TrmH family